jgi:hypothetical protein
MKVLIVYYSTYGMSTVWLPLLPKEQERFQASSQWSAQCPNSYRSP